MNSIVPVIQHPRELACWKGRDVPRFLVESYQGMEQDIAEFMRSYYYYQQNGDADNLNTVGMLTTADAQARYASLIQTGHLKEAFEKSTVQQLHEAQRTGWYMNLGAANDIHKVVDLVEEALAEQIENDPTGGTRYEYQRLLQVMNVIEEMALKAAASQGDTSQETSDNIAKAVLGMAANPKARRKMRESAKVVDIILHSDADEEEKLNMSAEIFREVANPDVTVIQFVSKNKTRMAQLGKEMVEPIPANVYLLAGKELIVIESIGEVTTRSIESSLRGLVDEFGVSDPVILITKLNEALYTKGKFDNYQLEDQKLVARSSGVKLPKPKHFAELVIREASTSKYYIEQLLEQTDHKVEIPIYQVYKNYVAASPTETLCAKFNIDATQENVIRINDAILGLYEIPKQLSDIFPGRIACIGTSHDNVSYTISLFLEEGSNYETSTDGSKVQT